MGQLGTSRTSRSGSSTPKHLTAAVSSGHSTAARRAAGRLHDGRVGLWVYCVWCPYLCYPDMFQAARGDDEFPPLEDTVIDEDECASRLPGDYEEALRASP